MSKKMKVLLLSRYSTLGASSRMRSLQYLPYFKSQGLDVTVKPLFSDTYVRSLYSGGSRKGEVIKGYIKRFFTLLRVKSYDVVIIEKELFPFLPAFAERLLRLFKVNYVVDYDDALFHRYDCHSNALIRLLLGKKIDTVMRLSTVVTAGNSYLAERAKQAGAKSIEIIPTVIDEERYKLKRKKTSGIFTIGWIGTPQTSQYLKPLLPIFEAIKEEFPVRFVAIGARAEDFEGTPVEAWPWSEDTEVSSIQQFDIGIMPLKDSPWERGKCGYKLIQYMACSIPVVASPVGVNCELVKVGKNGLLADTPDEWDQTIRDMLSVDLRELQLMGQIGYLQVKEWYSLQVQAPRFSSIIINSH